MGIRHIYLHNAGTHTEVGDATVGNNAVNLLAACHRCHIEVGHIGHFTLRIYEVDIGIGINGDEAMGFATPFDMG